MTPHDLRRQREALGLSQAEFARLIGMRGEHAGRTVRGWELGERETPGTVDALLYLMEMQPDALPALKSRAGLE